MKVVVATGNIGKYNELISMLGVPSIEFIQAYDIGEPEETGSTYVENAIIKAKYAAEKTGKSALADDSGLEIAALDHYPGIKSARCAGEFATDEEKVQYILGNMNDKQDRYARFICSMAFVNCHYPTMPTVFTGIVEGFIALKPEGKASIGLQYV